MLSVSLTDSSELSVARDGKTLTPIRKGSDWYVDIAGIPAKNILDET